MFKLLFAIFTALALSAGAEHAPDTEAQVAVLETTIPDLDQLWLQRDIRPLRDWLSSLDGTAENQPEALHVRARLAQLDGDFELAEQLIEQALELTDDSSVIRSRLLFERANVRLNELDDSGMFSSLRIARSLREDFEAAVALDPNFMQAWFGLMQFHEQAPAIAGGRDARAVEARVRVEELAPSLMVFNQALEIRSAGKLDTALARMNEAIKMAAEMAENDDSPPPGWLLMKGSLLQEMEQFEAAAEVLEYALEHYPQHAGLWYQRGRTSAESGLELGRGLEAMLKFNELPAWPGDPEPAAAWWRIGQIQQALGRIDGAREAFEYSLSLNPEFEESRQSLEALEEAGAG